MASATVKRRVFRPGLILLLCTLPAAAAELRKVEVEREDDHYRMTSEAYFEASPEDIYRVLTNYDLFVQFSSAYVESRNVPRDSQGRPRFFTRVEGCVLLFCRSFIRRGHLVLKPYEEIVAVAEPGDFAYSRERWRFRSEGEGTVLLYDFHMVPGFWVPPVIGPYALKRSLRSNGGDAIDRIEALALGRTPER